jgi:rod shape determining protein RodA
MFATFIDQAKKIDFIVILLILPIMIAGLLTMSDFDTSDSYFLKQSIWITIAIVAYILTSFIDYRFLKRTLTVMLVYGAGLGILTLLFVLGHVSKGAQSWFSFGGFSFQPSDIMKLVVIIVLAKYFSRRHVEIANVRHIIVSAIYTIIPFILIALQPDFGSAMIVLGLWFGLVLVSGISKKHLFAVLFLGIASVALLWAFVFKPYQKARIINFVNPLADIRGSGYNVYQSTIAVGSGGLFGKGVGYGTQSRLNYLPEYRTDFIFAAFAEEWGFIGSILLLILYAVLLGRIVSFAYVANSNFEALFMYGVVVWFGLHLVINVGMNIGLLPVTGIPLPMMSYGGSHLLAEMIALGMCVAMHRYSRSTHRAHMNNEFVGLE